MLRNLAMSLLALHIATPALADNGASGRLRADLLVSYDKGAYPWEFAWEAALADGGERSGLKVEMGINFHRVHSVDVVNHATDLIVWYRLRWHDPRLAWNASQYGGLATLQLWVGDGASSDVSSDIWTPDMTLWNQGESMQTSLSNAFASVSSDGTVFWSRPGHLRPTCKFVGLDRFPFDELGCTMEFGSWSFRPTNLEDGLYLRPVKMGDGFSIGGSETAGESFQEFSLEGVECRDKVYPPYPGDPENDWPVLLYEVVLNFIGFLCFSVPPQCGERLGLGITALFSPAVRCVALLAAVASDFVINGKLPAASEMTWFAQFSAFSLAYATLVLAESCIVSQARQADHIVVVSHGAIVEEGTHDALLRRNGAYAELVRVGDGLSDAETSEVVDSALGVADAAAAV
ncbi:hypothetical protein EMIHUDRAFT_224308 [Emiliania huxleyi CCMP1516]|uniref:Neurotransmitter-gated ion-channel ligand-binding domain-containing protein n=2 Tax=Emiliania huxleyi TaxID=2903 RepID=A0A0D3KS19_EMIH1|nr:hypothetical protein EMIHUDRAFT_224308 [Emiliania huxleyi CCMP1516]EOD38554.1 hypothetical protein EMIHUDRAFT_224308 [Emiliania huxleyi CCMP1516]|eukprot:XP_005790983.1 hypothetical protein EMIHUDRAFT_224308 [Emiliania huxleyi CCMP1516]